LVESLSTKERLTEASLRALNALVELFAHSLVVAALLGTIWLIEQLVHWLWGTSDYAFFDKIRLRYIFDGADLAILVGFVIWGVYSVVAAYVRKPKL
jgi:hypothetical protein